MKNTNYANLLNWLLSWVSKKGEINGFHNHSVWGTNPLRNLDMTCGHTTFASPLMPALAKLIVKCPDPQAIKLLQQLVAYQTSSFQPDGQYEHIGFQVGECCKVGLIHNVVPNVSLLLCVDIARDYLTEDLIHAVETAVRKNLQACEIYGGGHATNDSCCNQEYTRIWTLLLMKKVFQTTEYDLQIEQDLAFMKLHFCRKGFPDQDCCTVLRSLSGPKDVSLFEPAEYYGLMISPLVLAYELFKKEDYLVLAKELALHIVKSAWRDENEQIRFHRYWFTIKDKIYKIDKPMLIAGMGLTMQALLKLNGILNDVRIEDFLHQINHTYAYYQTNRGYFLSASAWGSEQDIVPSTAWHTQDLLYLSDYIEVTPEFWKQVFTPCEKASLLLGEQCYWMEQDGKWLIGNYQTMELYNTAGRKDLDKFDVEQAPWITNMKRLPQSQLIENKPILVKNENSIYALTTIEAEVACFPPLVFNPFNP